MVRIALQIVKLGILVNLDNIAIGESFTKSLVKIGKIGRVGKGYPAPPFCGN